MKATSQAYWYVITLEAREGGFRHPGPPGETPTHAGGVVVRLKNRRTEYLLVRASRAPGEWVLPKGHVEAGEAPPETAVREVREESGAWARVESELDDVAIVVHGAPILVRFHLMEWLEDGGDAEEGRNPTWLPIEEALTRATHEESRRMLRLAHERRGTVLRLPAVSQQPGEALPQLD